MPYRVLISAPYFLPVVDEFKTYFDQHDVEIIVADVEERLEEHQLLELIADVDGVLCGDDRFTEKVMEAAPRLKVIAKWGTGIDSIDADAASDRGICICRTPGAFTHPVADSVLGYILSFARNIPFMDEAMKRGEWKKIPGRALNESTIGVIGVGAIGEAVLERARPFGATLVGNDIRTIDIAKTASLGVEMTSLDDLLRRSDYISVNCDLTPESHHLINERTLGMLQSHAVLVNCARGPIIDEKALEKAVREGRIGGVAMDVFENEPLPGDSELRNYGNVLMAPHNSNSSPSAWQRVHLNTLDQLVASLKDMGSR